MRAHTKVAEPIVFGNEVHRRVQAEDVAALRVTAVANQHHILISGLVALVAKRVRVHHDSVQFVHLFLDFQVPLLQKLRPHEVIPREEAQQLAFDFANGARARVLRPIQDAVLAVLMVTVQHPPLLRERIHANDAGP